MQNNTQLSVTVEKALAVLYHMLGLMAIAEDTQKYA